MIKNNSSKNSSKDQSILDIVICGPDYSGTSTQVGDAIQFLKQQGLRVKDLRGNEVDAFFHTEQFQKLYSKFTSLKDAENFYPAPNLRDYFRSELRRGNIAAAVKAKNFSHINPNSADVFVMEEPTYRGSGMDIRSSLLYASQLKSEISPTTKAQAYAFDRLKEYNRFRKFFRKAGKIILRSRSEESACYQIFDKDYLKDGIAQRDYLSLEGNKVAFANPPTHIISVSGKEDWTIKDMIALREERNKNRDADDHEKDPHFQLMINKRYANHWLDNLYQSGCPKDTALPQIDKLYIKDSRKNIRLQIEGILDSALKEYGWK
ncbi:MAG: hypothetical protein ACLFNM_03055 [Candidatus Woesearchaeota archaeon]